MSRDKLMKLCEECGQPLSEHRRAIVGEIIWCPGDAIRTFRARSQNTPDSLKDG